MTHDESGNVVGSYSSSIGGGTPSASASLFKMKTTAENVADLAGKSYQVGGSIDVGASVGGEIVTFYSSRTNKIYYGFLGSAGIGFAIPTPIELHAGRTNTTHFNWDFNIFTSLYDAYDKIMEW